MSTEGTPVSVASTVAPSPLNITIVPCFCVTSMRPSGRKARPQGPDSVLFNVVTLGGGSVDDGNAFVSCVLVMPLSATVSVPLALTSRRKFAAVTGCAMCAFTCARSDTVTTRFWLTSPSKNPICTAALPPVPPSAEATSVSVTVTCCWLATAASGTISSLPSKVGVPAVAAPAVTEAVPPVTGLSKANTIV